MKKIIFTLLLLFSASLGASAQLNEVNRLPEVKRSHTQQVYSDYDRGFWIAAEGTGAYSCRLNHKNFGFGEITATAGYRFNEYVRVGLGFGGRYYIGNDRVRYYKEAWGFPLFANVRGNIIPTDTRDVVPYYSFDIGGTIRDGFMMRPTIGLRIGQKRSAMLIGLSYIGQYTKCVDFDAAGVRVPKGSFLNYVALRIGYEY